MTKSFLAKSFLIAILFMGSLTMPLNTAFCCIAVTANSQYIPADGETTADIKAEIDHNYLPYSAGCPIHFSITSGTGSLSPTSTTTDQYGIAHTTYAPSDSTPQTVTILAMSEVQWPTEGGGPITLHPGGTGYVYLVKTEIISPTEGGKVAITDTSQIAATAQLLQQAAIKLHWETTIGGTKFEADSLGTTNPQLVNITITFPDSNSSWGSNTLKAYLTEDPLCNDTHNVKCYFPAGGTQKSPINWYYYWKQTGATSGTHQYQENPPPDVGDANGYYSFGQNHFYICPSAGGLDGGLVAKGYGIDNFGSTCLHEKKHMDYWLATWGNVSSSPRNEDNDEGVGDGLKDADEPSMIGLNGQPYDPTKKDTNGDGYNDFEDLACKAENAWVENSYNAVDWAFPGHQYP